jgi:hypothetical protein
VGFGAEDGAVVADAADHAGGLAASQVRERSDQCEFADGYYGSYPTENNRDFP